MFGIAFTPLRLALRAAGSVGFPSRARAGCALALAFRVVAHDGTPDCATHGHAVSDPAALSAAVRVDESSGAAAAEATPIKFADFYVTPLGPRGLEFTPRIKTLDGRRVQIVGYMVHSRFNVPGTLLLTPYVVKVDDCHYGLADDLPPQTLHVTVPSLASEPVPYVPGPLLMTGKLELGPREQPDGRNFAVRLVLDSVASATAGAGSPGAGESRAADGSRSAVSPVGRSSDPIPFGGDGAAQKPKTEKPETQP